MASPRDSVPGTDPRGFIAVETLERVARGMSPEEFCATYPVPALVFVAIEEEKLMTEDTTQHDSGKRPTAPGKGGGAMAYNRRVAFLVKRKGNPFPDTIMIGRAPNNDLVVDMPSVSKFHATFENVQESWRLVPLPAVNGTTVNGAQVLQDQKRLLAEGDKVRFGEELEARFMPGESLYRWLTRLEDTNAARHRLGGRK